MEPLAVPERVAAKAVGVSEDTFKRLRRRGIGPPFIRVGSRSIRYPVAELQRWIATNARSSRNHKSGVA
ncbi:MAG: helix-turn-helix transcriptional regulator [Actinomycetes bacterium]